MNAIEVIDINALAFSPRREVPARAPQNHPYNLLDSLYHGYPVGDLIAWRNPTVKLRDGTSSAGKRILIDGQQRITALMAGLLGREVVTRDYETVRIRIVFHPLTQKFEVANPAIRKDVAWIEDVAAVFAQGLVAYATPVIETELPASFRTGMLPQLMDTSSAQSPCFLACKAAQVKLGLPGGRYNQIANFVLAQSEINIAIGDRAPEKYFQELAEQCEGGKKFYGEIASAAHMKSNLRANCLPETMLSAVSS